MACPPRRELAKTSKVAAPPVDGIEEREVSSAADSSCCVKAEATAVLVTGCRESASSYKTYSIVDVSVEEADHLDADTAASFGGTLGIFNSVVNKMAIEIRVVPVKVGWKAVVTRVVFSTSVLSGSSEGRNVIVYVGP